MATPLKLRLRKCSCQFLCIPSLPTLSSRPRNHSRGPLEPIRARSQQGIDPTSMARTLDQIDPVPAMHFEDIGYCVSGNVLRGPVSIARPERQTPIPVATIRKREFLVFVPHCSR